MKEEEIYKALEEAAKETQLEMRERRRAYNKQERIYEAEGISGHEVSQLLEKRGLKIPNRNEEHDIFLGIIEEKYKDNKPLKESMIAKLAVSDFPSDSDGGTLISPTGISLQGRYALGMDELLKECDKIQQAIEERIGEISQGKEEAIEKTIKMMSELEDNLEALDRDLESQTEYFFKDKSQNYNISIVEENSMPHRKFLSEISSNPSIINHIEKDPSKMVDQDVSRLEVFKRAEKIAKEAFEPQPKSRERANAMSKTVMRGRANAISGKPI